MGSMRLRKDMKVEIEHRPYSIVRSLNDGKVQFEAEDNGELTNLTQLELQVKIHAGEARILNTTKGTYPEIYSDTSMLPENEVGAMLRRHSYLKEISKPKHALTGRLLVEKCIKECSVRLNDPNPPSCPTVYRWMKNYREANEDIRALVPNTRRRGNRESGLMDQVQTIKCVRINSLYF